MMKFFRGSNHRDGDEVAAKDGDEKAAIKIKLEEAKQRLAELQEQHAPCAFTIREKEDELLRVNEALSSRDHDMQVLESSLKDLHTRHEALQEQHAPCAATIHTRDAEIASLRKHQELLNLTITNKVCCAFVLNWRCF